MTLGQLRSFLAVSRTGSVRAAARELFVSEPAVSSAIAGLQHSIGVESTHEQSIAASSKCLRTYVNDHRGGAGGATALVRRMLENNRGTTVEADLAIVAREISEDAATLDDVAETLRLADNPVKRVIARAGETLTRAKFSTGLHRNSPLGRLVELELLMAGIDAKRSLWRALKSASPPALTA